MAIQMQIQGAVSSPFKVLRGQTGFSLDVMAGAIYVKPETLAALESDDWERVTLGAPLVADLLSRVACVSAAKYQLPNASADDLSGIWHDGFVELGNAFNEASW